MIRAAKRLVCYQKPLVYTIVAATGQNIKKNYRTCNVRSTAEYYAEGPSKYETGG
jgi:hypothetical protein